MYTALVEEQPDEECKSVRCYTEENNNNSYLVDVNVKTNNQREETLVTAFANYTPRKIIQ